MVVGAILCCLSRHCTAVISGIFKDSRRLFRGDAGVEDKLLADIFPVFAPVLAESIVGALAIDSGVSIGVTEVAISEVDRRLIVLAGMDSLTDADALGLAARFGTDPRMLIRISSGREDEVDLIGLDDDEAGGWACVGC